MECPYCAQETKPNATVCPFCQRDLSIYAPLRSHIDALHKRLDSMKGSSEKSETFQQSTFVAVTISMLLSISLASVFFAVTWEGFLSNTVWNKLFVFLSAASPAFAGLWMAGAGRSIRGRVATIIGLAAGVCGAAQFYFIFRANSGDPIGHLAVTLSGYCIAGIILYPLSYYLAARLLFRARIMPGIVHVDQRQPAGMFKLDANSSAIIIAIITTLGSLVGAIINGGFAAHDNHPQQVIKSQK